MSHSDNSSQKYLDLYKLGQASIASKLHSNLAQPIAAAKLFAGLIVGIQGDEKNLQEARDLATSILDMTEQAYKVAYDLMRETEPNMAVDSGGSMKSSIENCGALLRFKDRGIKLHVFEELSSISIDCFVRAVVFDWIKALLIYLARHTKVSDVVVRLVGNEDGLNLEIVSDVMLSSEQANTELVIDSIRKQLQILVGTLLVNTAKNQTSLRIAIPAACEILTVIK